jgi:hypothetical protein
MRFCTPLTVFPTSRMVFPVRRVVQASLIESSSESFYQSSLESYISRPSSLLGTPHGG